MSTIKSKIAKLFKSKKVNVLMVFILLALLFSLLTKLSKDYTKTISFNVEMLNVPEENIILKDSLHKIKVTLTTYGFNLLKYYFVNPKMKVDFNKLKKEPNQYLWTKNSEFQSIVNQFNLATKINGISPDTINFRYDTRFVKKIPVVLNHEIEFASGFDIEESYQLKPDSIKVIGAKIALDSITKVETQTLILDEVNSDINTSISLKLPDSNPDIKFSKIQISVNAAVTKFTEGSVFVPIIITNLPKDVSIKYFPKEIEVTFYTSLDYYRTISGNSFKIECDYSKLDDENNRLIPNITKTDNKVRNVRLGTKSIEFIIQ